MPILNIIHEMNKKIFSHYTLIYMHNDDYDIKMIFLAFLTMRLYQVFICIDYWL